MKYLLPRYKANPENVPLTLQGSKFKLVTQLMNNIQWQGSGTLYSPFFGSGVFEFNVKSKTGIFSDCNPHIINLMRAIQCNIISDKRMRKYLFACKQELAKSTGEQFYYDQREKFNETGDPYIFLFLNLTCWRNLMRFNKAGKFNAPFYDVQNRYLTNRKDPKGRYIDLVLDHINFVRRESQHRHYEFHHLDFEEILFENPGEPKLEKLICKGKPGDFYFLDPPYVKRNTQYYQGFTEKQFQRIIHWTFQTKAGFALCNWYADKKGLNQLIQDYYANKGFPILKFGHSYHIGHGKNASAKSNRLIECVIIHPGNKANVKRNLDLFL